MHYYIYTTSINFPRDAFRDATCNAVLCYVDRLVQASRETGAFFFVSLGVNVNARAYKVRSIYRLQD